MDSTSLSTFLTVDDSDSQFFTMYTESEDLIGVNAVIVTVTSTVWPSVTRAFQLNMEFTECTRLDYTYDPSG